MGELYVYNYNGIAGENTGRRLAKNTGSDSLKKNIGSMGFAFICI